MNLVSKLIPTYSINVSSDSNSASILVKSPLNSSLDMVGGRLVDWSVFLSQLKSIQRDSMFQHSFRRESCLFLFHSKAGHVFWETRLAVCGAVVGRFSMCAAYLDECKTETEA